MRGDVENEAEKKESRPILTGEYLVLNAWVRLCNVNKIYANTCALPRDSQSYAAHVKSPAPSAPRYALTF